MAEYIYINNLENKGKIGISRLVFDEIVNMALSHLTDVSKSSSHLKKNQTIFLNRPIQTVIRSGIVHSTVYLDLSKKADEKRAKAKVEKTIRDFFETLTEQVPYEINIVIKNRI